MIYYKIIFPFGRFLIISDIKNQPESSLKGIPFIDIEPTVDNTKPQNDQSSSSFLTRSPS